MITKLFERKKTNKKGERKEAIEKRPNDEGKREKKEKRVYFDPWPPYTSFRNEKKGGKEEEGMEGKQSDESKREKKEEQAHLSPWPPLASSSLSPLRRLIPANLEKPLPALPHQPDVHDVDSMHRNKPAALLIQQKPSTHLSKMSPTPPKPRFGVPMPISLPTVRVTPAPSSTKAMPDSPDAPSLSHCSTMSEQSTLSVESPHRKRNRSVGSLADITFTSFPGIDDDDDIWVAMERDWEREQEWRRAWQQEQQRLSSTIDDLGLNPDLDLTDQLQRVIEAHAHATKLQESIMAHEVNTLIIDDDSNEDNDGDAFFDGLFVPALQVHKLVRRGYLRSRSRSRSSCCDEVAEVDRREIGKSKEQTRQSVGKQSEMEANEGKHMEKDVRVAMMLMDDGMMDGFGYLKDIIV